MNLGVFFRSPFTYDRNLQFTLEIEIANKISFLDVLIIRNLDGLNFTIYRKPTQNNRYLHFESNHPPQFERGVVISLVDRARIFVLIPTSQLN